MNFGIEEQLTYDRPHTKTEADLVVVEGVCVWQKGRGPPFCGGISHTFTVFEKPNLQLRPPLFIVPASLSDVPGSIHEYNRLWHIFIAERKSFRYHPNSPKDES